MRVLLNLVKMAMLVPSKLRLTIVALAVAALAACAGGKAVVPEAQDTGASATTGATLAGFPSAPRPLGGAVKMHPCNISGYWYFRGSCEAFYMNAKGITVGLNTYKGFRLTETFTASFAKKKDTSSSAKERATTTSLGAWRVPSTVRSDA
jgi:hypothetical protein